MLSRGVQRWRQLALEGQTVLAGVPGPPVGWGLTTDLCPTPSRRGQVVTLEMLIHAALIDYPRYYDPVTGQACPIEVALDRLSTGQVPVAKGLRLLAKAQGVMASYAWLWRR